MESEVRQGRGPFKSYPDRDEVIEYAPSPNKGRAVKWMQYLNIHKYASTPYLHAFTEDQASYYNETQELVKKLFNGGLIYRPANQQMAIKPDAMFLIYELTPKGIDYLKKLGLWVDAVKPSANWLHQYMTACITGSLHIMAKRDGVEYIGGHVVLERSGSTLGVDLPDERQDRSRAMSKSEKLYSRLVPDQIALLNYVDHKRFRLITPEADKGTEPKTSKDNRKTYERNIRQYCRFIEPKNGVRLYKKHYGTTAGIVVPLVFNSEEKRQSFLDEVGKQMRSCPYLVTQVISNFIPKEFQPPSVFEHLWTEPWKCHGAPDFYLNQP